MSKINPRGWSDWSNGSDCNEIYSYVRGWYHNCRIGFLNDIFAQLFWFLFANVSKFIKSIVVLCKGGVFFGWWSLNRDFFWLESIEFQRANLFWFWLFIRWNYLGRALWNLEIFWEEKYFKKVQSTFPPFDFIQIPVELSSLMWKNFSKIWTPSLPFPFQFMAKFISIFTPTLNQNCFQI